MTSNSHSSVEVVCMDEERVCTSVREDAEKLFQMLRGIGLDLGRVLVIVRRCGEQSMIHLGGTSISGINAISIFPTGVDRSFGFVEMLSRAISSYIYSQDILPSCPRWVVEGFSLYAALKVYSRFDPDGASEVEKHYVEAGERGMAGIEDLRSWVYRDHPAIQLIGKMLGEKVSKLLKAFYSDGLDRKECSDAAAPMRGRAYILVKKFLETREGHIDLRGFLASIAASGGECEKKIYGLGGGGDG
ncbi:MAG: hypothetical protein QXQ57_04375 [Sulfolobales archaeon]